MKFLSNGTLNATLKYIWTSDLRNVVYVNKHLDNEKSPNVF